MNNNISNRFLEAKMLRKLGVSPAVLLQGPRMCGKTTLARAVLEPQGYEYVNFNDPRTKKHVLDDISGFVADLPERAILDEVQKVPEMFGTLKVEIDRHRIPGRFLLASSCHVLMLPKLADSLAGRVSFLQLHPWSQSEMNRKRPCFLDALFGYNFSGGLHERLGDSLYQMIQTGGYPLADLYLGFNNLAGYYLEKVQGAVLRDMDELFRVDHKKLLGKILGLSARQTAKVMNSNKIAKDTGATMPTVKRYLKLLEHLFVLDILPSWFRNWQERQVKAPKLHIGDTGLACALLGIDAQMLRKDWDLRGQLLETFVYQELKRQASWRDRRIRFYHFRHKDRAEVNFVLEGRGQAVAGVTVKQGATLHRSDFKGLEMLAKAAGKDFVAGVVLYDGKHCVRRNDFYAVPIRLVWEMVQ